MKDFKTRNTRGAQKMADHGQRVPFWMGCYGGLDSISFQHAPKAYRNRLLAYLEGQTANRPAVPAGIE